MLLLRNINSSLSEKITILSNPPYASVNNSLFDVNVKFQVEASPTLLLGDQLGAGLFSAVTNISLATNK